MADLGALSFSGAICAGWALLKIRISKIKTYRTITIRTILLTGSGVFAGICF